MPLPQDEILTTPAIATLLKVVDRTIYTMSQTPEIPAFKTPDPWRVRQVDIDSGLDLPLQSRSKPRRANQ